MVTNFDFVKLILVKIAFNAKWLIFG